MTSINGVNQPMLRATSAGGGVNLPQGIDMNALLGTQGSQSSNTWQPTRYTQNGIPGTPYGAGSSMASFLDGLNNGVMAPTANAVAEGQALYQKQQARKQAQSAGLTSTSADGGAATLASDPNAMAKLQELFDQLKVIVGGGATDAGVPTTESESGSNNSVINAAEASEESETPAEKPKPKSLTEKLKAGSVKLTHDDVDKLDFKKLMSLKGDAKIDAIENIDMSGLSRSDKDRVAAKFAVAANGDFADKIGYPNHDNLGDRNFSAHDLHVIADLAKRCGQKEISDSIDVINSHRGNIAKAGGGEVSQNLASIIFNGPNGSGSSYVHREELVAIDKEMKNGKKSIWDLIKEND